MHGVQNGERRIVHRLDHGIRQGENGLREMSESKHADHGDGEGLGREQEISPNRIAIRIRRWQMRPS
jgi:hypothetical protein